MAGVTAAGGYSTSSSLLLDLVREIAPISGVFGNVFRKDCTDLVRRISLLAHLFEEIRDSSFHSGPSDAPLADSSSSYSGSWTYDLVVALQAAKRVLLTAGSFDSASLSDGATKKIAFQFQSVTWNLEKALDNLPYHRFDISEEVQEQVDLVRTQLRRATGRYESFNSQLLSRPIDKEFDLLNMGFSDGGGSINETKSNPEAVSTGSNSDQMINGSGSLRKSASSSEIIISNYTNPDSKENLSTLGSEEIKKADPLVIPDDFLCPISLELMRDPVIVATGQTYERSYIQRWIDCGNLTCPKTQQKLVNSTLTPNYVLRSLISQWCTKHKIEQPTGMANGRIRKSDGTFQDVSRDMAAIRELVRKLSSQSVNDCRSSTAEIRSLSKRSTDNRILIAEAGGIPALVSLLTTDDLITQENAVTCILNLSIYESNKALIMLAGAVPSIVHVLRGGNMEARENAAATLFSLSVVNENKIIIGASGAIPALVGLLETGSVRGKKDAATALFNLCIYPGNKSRAVRAGIVSALMEMLTDSSSSSMADEALTILSVLASHPEARAAIMKASVVPVLVGLLRNGQPRNGENAAAILLSLCKRDLESLASVSRLGAVLPLTELARSGTERAKRKATSLLEHLRRL